MWTQKMLVAFCRIINISCYFLESPFMFWMLEWNRAESYAHSTVHLRDNCRLWAVCSCVFEYHDMKTYSEPRQTVLHFAHGLACSWVLAESAYFPESHCRLVGILFRIQDVSGSNLYSRLDSLRIFVILLSPYRQISGRNLKLGHDRFLPHPLCLITN